jgi:oxygen-independent coproporphyrinogen-3 oxidase
MHGLINQSIDEGLSDLQQAIDLNPNHISWYQLTLEPNTVFAKKPPSTSSMDTIFEMEQQGFEILNQHGYGQYEVSAFAKENQQCQHNLNYWQFGDYIGLGAGAHGKLTNDLNQTVLRTTHYKRPETYMHSQNDFANIEVINKKDLPFEFMLNALRLNQPVSFELFETRTGLSRFAIQATLQELAKQDFISIDTRSFELTPLGRRYLNDVVAAFL